MYSRQPLNEIPNSLKSITVARDKSKPFESERKFVAINPPIDAPPAKTKFHICDFQFILSFNIKYSNAKLNESNTSNLIAKRSNVSIIKTKKTLFLHL
jgi:hypothetical protein